ncbi:HNH endonuclease [Nitrososphaeria virus YSH_462411]|uniref:HNH endonuclease n=1 Tax=Nitrososphaeria virus YSH_462411 TaxID=3071321 RepID=A0A976UBD8_9CAUD|nr:HNH endonuclease [Yangshan Harbor Nitrososphaeria virus]UVF62330.1 HNH endonuclease [Nitrososphaeria virus YSH_462411]
MNQKELNRFMNMVDKTGNCWEWVGSKNWLGYGQFSFYGKTTATHRLSYQHYKGEIPDGMVLDHLCRVRHCINPEHLEVVTNKENILRGRGATANNSKKTHCKNGHEFNEENTYYRKKGRDCRECHRITENKRRLKIKEILTCEPCNLRHYAE